MQENLSGKVPIVVGVGDIINRSVRIEDAREPALLMLDAILQALQDTGLVASKLSHLRCDIDSLDVISTWTWPYTDLPGLLAQKLEVSPSHRFTSPHGGNQPAKLFDEAARRIADNGAKVAVITGGEALASLSACVAAQQIPPPGWSATKSDVKEIFSPTTRPLGEDLGAKHAIGAPIQVYPLFENGYRHHRAQSIEENHNQSAALYAGFSDIAHHNPVAWSYGRSLDSGTIRKVTKQNRMICFPYPLLMNAFNTVNLAAAVILTSTEYAQELGIPRNKWIYPLGGAGTQDSDEFWLRPDFYSSPAISRSLDAALEVCNLKKEDVDIFDFYSCFPIVPKIAADHLNLSLLNSSRPVTLLGGLTSFGGAGNNYSMHAITELTRALRTGKGRTGLVLANGGVMTYQHVVCLSSSPRNHGSYPASNPLPKVITDVQVPEIEEQASGEAVIETYTVEFNRDGSPKRGYIIGRLKASGRRFLANHGSDETLKRLARGTEEMIGVEGIVRPDGQAKQLARNLFEIESACLAKL